MARVSSSFTSGSATLPFHIMLSTSRHPPVFSKPRVYHSKASVDRVHRCVPLYLFIVGRVAGLVGVDEREIIRATFALQQCGKGFLGRSNAEVYDTKERELIIIDECRKILLLTNLGFDTGCLPVSASNVGPFSGNIAGHHLQRKGWNALSIHISDSDFSVLRQRKSHC